MKKILVSALLFVLITCSWGSPMHFKLNHTVIIDTDCNPEDMRALILLLSTPHINVRGIIVSGNTADAELGLREIKTLLRNMNMDTVVTGISINDDQLYRDIISKVNEKPMLVALGGLTNIALMVRNDPGIKEKIEELIWYNNSVKPLQGYNYELDKVAAEYVLNSGLPVDVISDPGYKNSVFNTSLTSVSAKSSSDASKLFAVTFRSPAKQGSSKNPGFKIGEELAAVALANHELFEMAPTFERSVIHYITRYEMAAVNDVITDLLNGSYRSGHFVALRGFPLNRDLYAYDIRLIMDEAIARYGTDEWKACVMTDEFHGHLGVYSIVGAKMGILARDYFGVGTDVMEIYSYAGTVTPFSCMNDGLQASTGATLGQGTIHLVNEPFTRPQAIFKYNDKSILVSLKPEYLRQLQAVIGEGVRNFGLEDEGYWHLVRQASIRFWLEWDRKDIFELKNL